MAEKMLTLPTILREEIMKFIPKLTGVVLSAAIMAQSVPFVYAAEKSIASSELQMISRYQSLNMLQAIWRLTVF